MHFRFIILAIILVSNLNSNAQGGLNTARKEMSIFNYSRAVELLQKEISRNDDKSKCEAALLLADCFRMLNDVANAKIWYANAIQLAGHCRNTENPDPKVYLNYAQALRSSGEYPLAKKVFLQYDSLVRGQQVGALFAAYCDSAVAWQATKPEFEIRNVTALNTPESEFGTVFYQHGIIFASDRVSSTGANKIYGWTGHGYLNLYYSEPVGNDSILGDFILPRPSLDLPGQVWHDGPVSFNHDFTKVFLNQTQLKRDKGKKDAGRIRTHLLKIFSSLLKEGKWSTPEPFFLNSDEYSVGHPALAQDGKTLYFVSDMPGGYGETDIWFCRHDGNTWSGPVNMGPVINTPGKEMFPYVAANGDLYFASDGQPGLGGLDLFLTRKADNKWTVPHNLGYPLNSSYDDFSVIISVDNNSGLFSSNRPGGIGSDDIYSFKKIRHADKKAPDPIVPDPLAQKLVTPPDSFVLDTLKINKSYRLENIFYDFDKWNIRPDAKPSLDNLVSILKEYPVSIEFSSHTDCRGTEVYNMQLSQKRAESAVQYIISNGIPASRIVAKGYGKSKLLNHCDCSNGIECSEDEHQYNRRTEFRITGIIEK